MANDEIELHLKIIIPWIIASTGVLITFIGLAYILICRRRKLDIKGWVPLRMLQIAFATVGLICYLLIVRH